MANQPGLEWVEALARQAGEVLKSHDRRRVAVERKGRRDLVTAADLESERFIVGSIRAAYPGHRIIAEEGHDRGVYAVEAPTWIIDPLDGTTNFVHGIPHVAVSIAFWSGGRPVLACVLNPILQECFTAESGRGAWLNGDPVTVSGTDRLEDALLGTGFHYRREEQPDSNLEHVADFLYKVRCLRRLGAASLDLCYVAASRLDGFWELWLSPWDVAAGGLIAAEAGARVTDLLGGDGWLFGGSIVAAGPPLHRAMMDVLRSANPERLPGPGFQANGPGGRRPSPR